MAQPRRMPQVPMFPWPMPAAFAHGDDHDAPAAPAADHHRNVATGTRTEAALLVPHDGGRVELWLADEASAAPITEGAVRLQLSGPSALTLPLSPGPHAGSWFADADALPAGDWAATIVVDGPHADLMVLDDITLVAHAEPATPHAEIGMLPVALAAMLLLGLALGFGLGRRAAVAALVGVLVWGPRRGYAHGDDGHAPPASEASGLRVGLDSQLLVGLRTERVTRGDARATLRAPGVAATSTGELHLEAPVGGRLIAGDRPLHVGARVAADERLFTIAELPGAADRAALAVERSRSVAALAEAQRTLTLAERDEERAVTLAGSLSARELLDRTLRLDAARAAVTQAQAAVDATAGAAPTALRAPWAARVLRVHASPGAQVQPGAPLVDLLGDDEVGARVLVPEARANLLRPDGRARVQVTGEETPRDGWIVDLGGVVDASTGMVTVTLRLDPPAAVRPGASVIAWLEVGAIPEAIVAPESALLIGAGAPYVFVKRGPEQFEVREVRTGARVEGGRVIEAGLHPGERIVTAEAWTLQRAAGR